MKQPQKRSLKQAQLPLNLITGTNFKRIVWTLGHGVKSIEIFQERLLAHKIDRVIDVRTKPYSRWHPQFNKNQLAYLLAEIDVNYDWRGFNLGGLSKNVDYEKTIRWVNDRAEHENIVLLCSESDYKKCHRFTMLTPDLEKLGASVVHIGYVSV